MRVLVTGHRGYIGTVLTPMLLRAGHGVVGLDSDLFAACTFDAGGGIEEVPSIDKDLRAVAEPDLEGFDAILHLAGLSNDPLGNFRPEITYAINHRATVDLAAKAKAAGVGRFVFSSSCSNYGAAGQEVLDEQSAFNPVTPYGKSKVMAEQELLPLADDAFSPVLMRSATACGVSPRIRFDLVVNNLVAWAVSTGKVFLKSDGSAWRPIVHIEDISRAFVAVLEAPRDVVHAQAFNVGSTAENYRIREIAEIVAEVVPDCRVEFADTASADARNYRVSCDKLERTFPSAKAQWTVRKSAQQVYEALQRQPVSPEEFEGERFQRIAHVKKLIADGMLDEGLRRRDG